MGKPASYLCLSSPYQFKFFKRCIPQILLGPFLNTLSHIRTNDSIWPLSFNKIINNYPKSAIFGMVKNLVVFLKQF